MTHTRNDWLELQSRIARRATELDLWENAPEDGYCPVETDMPILAKMEAGDYVGPVMAGSFDWDHEDAVAEYVLVENTGKKDLVEKFIPVRKIG